MAGFMNAVMNIYGPTKCCEILDLAERLLALQEGTDSEKLVAWRYEYAVFSSPVAAFIS
jgi:hypothetical protein